MVGRDSITSRPSFLSKPSAIRRGKLKISSPLPVDGRTSSYTDFNSHPANLRDNIESDASIRDSYLFDFTAPRQLVLPPPPPPLLHPRSASYPVPSNRTTLSPLQQNHTGYEAHPAEGPEDCVTCLGDTIIQTPAAVTAAGAATAAGGALADASTPSPRQTRHIPAVVIAPPAGTAPVETNARTSIRTTLRRFLTIKPNKERPRQTLHKRISRHVCIGPLSTSTVRSLHSLYNEFGSGLLT